MLRVLPINSENERLEPPDGGDVLETHDGGGDVLDGEIFLLHRDVLLDPRLVQPGKRWIAHHLSVNVYVYGYVFM